MPTKARVAKSDEQFVGILDRRPARGRAQAQARISASISAAFTGTPREIRLQPN